MTTVQENTQSGLFGQRLGRHVEMVSQSLLQVSKGDRLSLAVTRLTCMRQERERTVVIEPEAAFSATYKLRDVEEHELWLGGRMRYARGFAAGTVSAADLTEDPRSRIRGPFDGVQFYMRKEALDDLAYERGASQISTLRASPDASDPILAAMCGYLLSAPPELAQTNPLFVDQMALSLLTYFAEGYGGMHIPPAAGQWQACILAGASRQGDHAFPSGSPPDDRRHRAGMPSHAELFRQGFPPHDGNEPASLSDAYPRSGSQEPSSVLDAAPGRYRAHLRLWRSKLFHARLHPLGRCEPWQMATGDASLSEGEPAG